jgi:hypothetical protein
MRWKGNGCMMKRILTREMGARTLGDVGRGKSPVLDMIYECKWGVSFGTNGKEDYLDVPPVSTVDKT